MTNEEHSGVAETWCDRAAESGIDRQASQQDDRWGNVRNVSGRPLSGTTREAAGVEATVLGTMLFDRSVIEHVWAVVEAGDFFGGLNRRVFSALAGIHLRQAARVDVDRLDAELSRELGISGLKDSAYLADLRAGVCVPGTDVARQARWVREASGWRRVIDLGERTIRAAHQGAQEGAQLDHVAVRLVGNAFVLQEAQADAPRRGELFRGIVGVPYLGRHTAGVAGPGIARPARRSSASREGGFMKPGSRVGHVECVVGREWLPKGCSTEPKGSVSPTKKR